MKHSPKKSYLEYHPSVAKSIIEKWANEPLRIKHCEKFLEFLSLMVERLQNQHKGELETLIDEVIFLRGILKEQCKNKEPPPRIEVQAGVESYRHIVKKLTVYWGSAFVLEYLDSLLYVERGGRMGFSLETHDELKFLQLFLEKHFDVTQVTKPTKEEREIIERWKKEKGDHWRFRNKEKITFDMIEFTANKKKEEGK
jgi:hypothetical protein